MYSVQGHIPPRCSKEFRRIDFVKTSQRVAIDSGMRHVWWLVPAGTVLMYVATAHITGTGTANSAAQQPRAQQVIAPPPPDHPRLKDRAMTSALRIVRGTLPCRINCCSRWTLTLYHFGQQLSHTLKLPLQQEAWFVSVELAGARGGHSGCSLHERCRGRRGEVWEQLYLDRLQCSAIALAD